MCLVPACLGCAAPWKDTPKWVQIPSLLAKDESMAVAWSCSLAGDCPMCYTGTTGLLWGQSPSPDP